jgi:hypothetical protein
MFCFFGIIPISKYGNDINYIFYPPEFPDPATCQP